MTTVLQPALSNLVRPVSNTFDWAEQTWASVESDKNQDSLEKAKFFLNLVEKILSVLDKGKEHIFEIAPLLIEVINFLESVSEPEKILYKELLLSIGISVHITTIDGLQCYVAVVDEVYLQPK